MSYSRLFFTLFFVPLFLFASPFGEAEADNLFPIGVRDARIAPLNQGELRIGGAYNDELNNLFQREDVNRRVLAFPTLFLNLGLGERVEGHISYSYLRLQSDGQRTRWGSGDTRIGFKLGLFPDCPDKPATALMVTTKLPNADDREDFGTDEADNYIDLLVSENFGKVGAHLNLGMAILGAPGEREGQDDLLRYAAGLRFPLGRKGAFLIGVQGMDLGKGVNQRGVLQAGFRIPFGRLIWDIGGSIGYVDNSQDWGIRTGLSIPATMPRLLCHPSWSS
ncbi:MAG TPA: hypothetical protein VJ882_01270 [Desulfuromonadales bacterium]|nr:hypothetical protein [Desulfuromonadales bacterium]